MPIPAEAAEEGEEIEVAIQDALSEASEAGCSGRDLTPFVLSKVNSLTEGKSLRANIKLVENNADVGARIAKELGDLRVKGDTFVSAQHNAFYQVCIFVQ